MILWVFFAIVMNASIHPPEVVVSARGFLGSPSNSSNHFSGVFETCRHEDWCEVQCPRVATPVYGRFGSTGSHGKCNHKILVRILKSLDRETQLAAVSRNEF
jgi:hypothetical protein